MLPNTFPHPFTLTDCTCLMRRFRVQYFAWKAQPYLSPRIAISIIDGKDPSRPHPTVDTGQSLRRVFATSTSAGFGALLMPRTSPIFEFLRFVRFVLSWVQALTIDSTRQSGFGGVFRHSTARDTLPNPNRSRSSHTICRSIQPSQGFKGGIIRSIVINSSDLRSLPQT